MRIPFWPKRRPTELVVTFTQEIDLEALASGKQGVFAGTMALAIVCSCAARMSGNAPWVVTRSNSLTQPYTCDGCSNKVDVTYTYDAKQPEAVFDTDKGGEVLDWGDAIAKHRSGTP